MQVVNAQLLDSKYSVDQRGILANLSHQYEDKTKWLHLLTILLKMKSEQPHTQRFRSAKSFSHYKVPNSVCKSVV